MEHLNSQVHLTKHLNQKKRKFLKANKNYQRKRRQTQLQSKQSQWDYLVNLRSLNFHLELPIRRQVDYLENKTLQINNKPSPYLADCKQLSQQNRNLQVICLEALESSFNLQQEENLVDKRSKHRQIHFRLNRKIWNQVQKQSFSQQLEVYLEERKLNQPPPCLAKEQQQQNLSVRYSEGLQQAVYSAQHPRVFSKVHFCLILRRRKTKMMNHKVKRKKEKKVRQSMLTLTKWSSREPLDSKFRRIHSLESLKRKLTSLRLLNLFLQNVEVNQRASATAHRQSSILRKTEFVLT